MRSILAVLATLSLPALAVADKAPAPPAKTFEIRDNKLVVPSKVWFKTGSAELKDSDEALAHVASYLAEKSYITLLRVEVHADADGDAGEAQALSEKRSLAVARALVAKGVACKRLLPVGFGNTKPIADNATAEGKASNRRVEFANAELRGRPIGGMPIDGGGRVGGDPCAK